MGVLDYVIRKKALERERELSDINAIGDATDLFLKARESKLKSLREFEDARNSEEVSLAKSGLMRDSSGNIVRNENLVSPIEELINRGKVADAQMKIYEAGGPPPSGLRNFVPVSTSSLPSQSPIDMNKPRIQNDDGSVSTERSITVEMDGKFMNIPTVVDGQELTPEEAIKKATTGGEILGTFDNLEDALSGAQQRSDTIGRNIQKEPKIEAKTWDRFGRPLTYGLSESDKTREQMDKEMGERAGKAASGSRASINNLENLVGVLTDLTNLHAEAIFKERGAGDPYAAWFGEKAGSGFFGRDFANKYSATKAYSGKKEEVILKMMPMLTQQAEKPEGSMRIITSVLDAIGKTLPDLGTPDKIAARMTGETIRSFYRFARAAEANKMTIDEYFNNRDIESLTDEEIKTFAHKVKGLMSRIELTPEENKQINYLQRILARPYAMWESGKGVSTFDTEIWEKERAKWSEVKKNNIALDYMVPNEEKSLLDEINRRRKNR